MEDFGNDKEFIDEQIIDIICESIKNVFGIKVKYENIDQTMIEVCFDDNDKEKEKQKLLYESTVYNRDKATQWVNQLIDNCIKALVKLNKPFKYVVNCILQQNTGAPMNSFGCAYFDETDGAVTKGVSINDIFCSITIFAMFI